MVAEVCRNGHVDEYAHGPRQKYCRGCKRDRASARRKVGVVHTPEVLVRRLLHNTVEADGCLLWQGARGRGGYGVCHKPTYGEHRPHRAVVALLRGPIPDGHDVDHLCRVPACINPEHLQVREHLDHCTDNGWNLRSHCPQGHAYTPDNTYTHTASDGRTRRHCRACHRDRQRARKAS